MRSEADIGLVPMVNEKFRLLILFLRIIVGVAMAPLAIVPLIVYSPLGDKIAGPDLNWGRGVAWTAVLLISGASVQIIARHLHRRATQTS